jgi:hypothetical protein
MSEFDQKNFDYTLHISLFPLSTDFGSCLTTAAASRKGDAGDEEAGRETEKFPPQLRDLEWNSIYD